MTDETLQKGKDLKDRILKASSAFNNDLDKVSVIDGLSDDDMKERITQCVKDKHQGNLDSLQKEFDEL